MPLVSSCVRSWTSYSSSLVTSLAINIDSVDYNLVALGHIVAFDGVCETEREALRVVVILN